MSRSISWMFLSVAFLVFGCGGDLDVDDDSADDDTTDDDDADDDVTDDDDADDDVTDDDDTGDDDTGDDDDTGQEMTCAQAMACIEACHGMPKCADECVAAVCPLSETALNTLLMCMGDSCPEECNDAPQSPECHECVELHCLEQFEVCQDVGC